MSTSPEKPNYVKVMLFLKRREECSDEKFHSHWRTNHIEECSDIKLELSGHIYTVEFGSKTTANHSQVELAMQNPNFVDKVRRYNQVHTSKELKAEAAGFGIPVLDFDGIAEVWVDSLEDWKSVVTDPDFIKNIAPDEAVFIAAPITIMFGYDNLVIGTDRKTGCESQIEGQNI